MGPELQRDAMGLKPGSLALGDHDCGVLLQEEHRVGSRASAECSHQLGDVGASNRDDVLVALAESEILTGDCQVAILGHLSGHR